MQFHLEFRPCGPYGHIYASFTIMYGVTFDINSLILVSNAIYMTLCTRLLHDDPMKSSMHAIEGDTSLDRPSCNGRSDYSLCVQKFHIF